MNNSYPVYAFNFENHLIYYHQQTTFEQRGIQTAVTYGTQHQLIAFIQSFIATRCRESVKDTLSSRMESPLHRFNGFSFDSNQNAEIPDEIVTLPSVNLPYVEQLPRSIAWAFTARHKQIYYVDGEAMKTSSDSDEGEGDGEEIEKEKLEFSKDADRLIWIIGQEHSLDDIDMQTALSKCLGVDVSDILERYNELNKLKNEGIIREASDKCIASKFRNALNLYDGGFCRRCLKFNCQMHEEYQPMNGTKISNLSEDEDEDVREECSEHCYLKLRRSFTEADQVLVDSDNSMSNKKEKNVVSDINEVPKDLTEMPITSQACNEWTAEEKSFYLDGVGCFGKNSCLISRNVFPGVKTCLEVYNYMREQDQSAADNAETNVQVRKEVSRKKHRMVKKIKPRKSGCYPTAFKRRACKENKPLKHYTPCTCEPTCGDNCPCIANENCCEKYCRCVKICKNRFGGCSCAKGQCINGQCPCFAASRECDPDLCQNCSLSCGNESHTETSVISQCKNMRFLIKKSKKTRIARSNVQGWGAFAAEPLKKNDFLGEYTGELISHEEADERSRPDEHNSAYLFTLNDQMVIDARRKGNKLRFLNHSAKPNCYAKMMIVRGDHRIGLFAYKAIDEGEELFFDYCYGPGQKAWALSGKPRKSGGGGGGPKRHLEELASAKRGSRARVGGTRWRHCHSRLLDQRVLLLCRV
ncbi:unnamed protein product [Microthlaspi erraticum]|uniref:Uncharacterized protein n=1 Tax=Microthlaspi erraticum TaxID=1685480 RepID=A0A6D2KS85_9BRAS|nr:unnamed protein product [Microthlaspi erraticum]